MNKTIVLSIVGILLLGTAANADFNLSVTTDKMMYIPGETVNWTLWAWADVEGSGAGISLISVGLSDNTGEQMNEADTEMLFGIIPSLENSEYSALQRFVLQSPGVATLPGQVIDITTLQFDATRMLNVGNDGQMHVYATGSYTYTRFAAHYLEPIFTAANYWSSDTGPAMPFTLGSVTGCYLYHPYDPIPGDANSDWLVDGTDLALWQQNYDPMGANPFNAWYRGDWNDDDKINGADLALWQQNYRTPEPATIMLLGTGLLAGMGVIRRRKLC